MRLLSGACACLAAALGLAGVVLIVLSQVYYSSSSIEEFKTQVHSMMFIDSTTDTSSSGPLGESASDKSMFEQWRKSSVDAYNDCVNDGGEDCAKGAAVAVGIFNVTNPLGVALGGQVPMVKEIGPIYARRLSSKTGVDETAWNEMGVARYVSHSSFEIDSKRCDAACQDILDLQVVVVNPVWATLGWVGEELDVLYTIVAKGLSAERSIIQLGILTTGFGLSVLDVAYFKAAFLNATVPSSEVLERVKTFRATCRLAADYKLTADKCSKALQGFRAFVTTNWDVMQKQFLSEYGVGQAMPVFIRAKVREVLGLDGAHITDPMTQLNVSYKLFSDSERPRESQMASKYGEDGVNYRIGQDCSVDAGCTLTVPSNSSSCVPSDTCRPRPLKGYQTQVPARAWGQGYSTWSSPGAVAPFSIGIASAPFAAEGAKTKVVDADTNVSYNRFTPVKFERQLMACGSDHPGIDCDGPAGTLLVSHDKHVYLSAPLFDTSGFRNASTMDDGQAKIPYSPLERVEITRCIGSAWCVSGTKYDSYFDAEPESGKLFEAQVSLQLNARIGKGTSDVPGTNTTDTLVPVYWCSTSFRAAQHQLQVLAQLQKGPSAMEMMESSFVYAGAGLVALSLLLLCCCVVVPACVPTKGEAAGEASKKKPPEQLAEEARPLKANEAKQEGALFGFVCCNSAPKHQGARAGAPAPVRPTTNK